MWKRRSFVRLRVRLVRPPPLYYIPGLRVIVLANWSCLFLLRRSLFPSRGIDGTSGLSGVYPSFHMQDMLTLTCVELNTEEDLIPPGAKPGTVPNDVDHATGLERLELIGKMQGIDIFDMRPLDASRKGIYFTC